ncbi:MAG: dTDP-4-dehydrorhamnose 3,5-epimerase [Eubacteriales bacterium]|nr:dTDP-4-dehydrorhamnose 3,5-epimerase [Eubacteriales bacterium]
MYYNDPQIHVDWGVAEPTLSTKDASAPCLSESDCNFTYEG